MQPSFLIENNYQNLFVAGIDEAGRGPLAGPVVAACVILDREDFPPGKNCEINDSKKLSKLRRQKIFSELKNKAKFGIGIVDEKIIDEINILEATKLAMLRAYLDLQKKYQIFPNLLFPGFLRNEAAKTRPLRTLAIIYRYEISRSLLQERVY